ncbi:MAG: efflux RND transporter periplasmic adaptor subunit [Tannerella sp.]|jgi:cobalt-zinc-cadmium efflux system membrane fusion protein|nr:efflux RND transporter periplasmic adaptor subunit [Tannerella sp.]
MKKRLSSLFCLFVCVACANRSGSDETAGKTFSVEGEYITVAEQSPVLKHIKIQPVEKGDYRPSFSASGVVTAIPSQYAGIASPFAGRIVKAWVCPGQRVAAGSPVFAVSSPDFTEIGKACFQARAEMELAQKNLLRERDLLANRVGVAKEVEEIEADCEIKRTEYERALAAIQVYQVDPDSLTLGQPLVVRSPLAGEVVKSEIVVGQYIREDADALVIVADLDRVWVKAQVKEKDLPLLDCVADIRISLPALPDTLITGTIRYVGYLLDEETRSVEVMVECENRDRRMKPFMYGTVRFTGTPAPAVMAPEAAVLQGEDSRYVIVSEGKNHFRKVNVTTVPDAENHRTVILSGVGEGEAVVTEGAFYFIEAR